MAVKGTHVVMFAALLAAATAVVATVVATNRNAGRTATSNSNQVAGPSTEAYEDGEVSRYKMLEQTLIGLWDVDNSIADWRFGPNGAFLEEGVTNWSGTYDILADDGLKIQMKDGPLLLYRCKLFGDTVVLEGDRTTPTLKLTRRK